MIGGRSVLAVIPARGGSKGVPGKNIKTLAGKPLIAWTIEEARRSKYIDRCVISSEDADIQRVAEEWGGEVPFSRPVELAQDDTPGYAPVLHAVRQLPSYDYIVLLQPTSPLRTTQDIDGCIECCFHEKSASCVSVVEADKSPYWMFHLDDRQTLVPVMEQPPAGRRQDLPSVYALNGAIYVVETEHVLRTERLLDSATLGYPMSKEHSVDIDTYFDFEICELYLRLNGRI